MLLRKIATVSALLQAKDKSARCAQRQVTLCIIYTHSLRPHRKQLGGCSNRMTQPQVKLLNTKQDLQKKSHTLLVQIVSDADLEVADL